MYCTRATRKKKKEGIGQTRHSFAHQNARTAGRTMLLFGARHNRSIIYIRTHTHAASRVDKRQEDTHPAGSVPQSPPPPSAVYGTVDLMKMSTHRAQTKRYAHRLGDKKNTLAKVAKKTRAVR